MLVLVLVRVVERGREGVRAERGDVRAEGRRAERADVARGGTEGIGRVVREAAREGGGGVEVGRVRVRAARRRCVVVCVCVGVEEVGRGGREVGAGAVLGVLGGLDEELVGAVDGGRVVVGAVVVEGGAVGVVAVGGLGLALLAGVVRAAAVDVVGVL